MFLSLWVSTVVHAVGAIQILCCEHICTESTRSPGNQMSRSGVVGVLDQMLDIYPSMPKMSETHWNCLLIVTVHLWVLSYRSNKYICRLPVLHYFTYFVDLCLWCTLQSAFFDCYICTVFGFDVLLKWARRNDAVWLGRTFMKIHDRSEPWKWVW